VAGKYFLGKQKSNPEKTGNLSGIIALAARLKDTLKGLWNYR